MSPRVAIVTMPGAPVHVPSIQAGTLKSSLMQAGFQCDVLYGNLSFLQFIGANDYGFIFENTPTLLSDWLFTDKAMVSPLNREYLNLFPVGNSSHFSSQSDLSEFLMNLRSRAEIWIDNFANSVTWTQYDIIGFSCSFSQTIASLALTQLIRQKHPDVVIVFGGATLFPEAAEEILQHSSALVDCIVVGYGESAIVQIAQTVGRGEAVQSLYIADTPDQIDMLAIPDFDEYFAIVNSSKFLTATGSEVFGSLCMESSRGCWWGAKSQCLFCGLNPSHKSYSAKSPERIAAEIDILASRYQRYDVTLCDTILPAETKTTLIPFLGEGDCDFNLFAEIRIASTFNELRNMYMAGFKRVQPGIESLDSHMLQVMRKGTKSFQVVQFLQWAAFLGIDVAWNIIYGFPGETEECYANQIRIIRLIRHLQPPVHCGRVRLDRFSPLTSRLRAYDSRILRPSPAYRYCFPPEFNLEKIALHFVGIETGVTETIILIRPLTFFKS